MKKKTLELRITNFYMVLIILTNTAMILQANRVELNQMINFLLHSLNALFLILINPLDGGGEY
jgi:hypothetical protein